MNQPCRPEGLLRMPLNADAGKLGIDPSPSETVAVETPWL